MDPAIVPWGCHLRVKMLGSQQAQTAPHSDEIRRHLEARPERLHLILGRGRSNEAVSAAEKGGMSLDKTDGKDGQVN